MVLQSTGLLYAMAITDYKASKYNNDQMPRPDKPDVALVDQSILTIAAPGASKPAAAVARDIDLHADARLASQPASPSKNSWTAELAGLGTREVDCNHLEAQLWAEQQARSRFEGRINVSNLALLWLAVVALAWLMHC
jgi:hypothetical protein